ncbi:MAG: hypothetical protein AB8B99_00680 [Phormidesmis sp.]
MNFSSEQIAPGKWGIYSGSTLLATVSSEAICKTVMANLANGRKDLPLQDANALYQISAELKAPLVTPTQPKPSSHAQSMEDMFDSLSEQQLEDALIKAQQRSIVPAKAQPSDHQPKSATKKARAANGRATTRTVLDSSVTSGKAKSGKAKSGKKTKLSGAKSSGAKSSSAKTNKKQPSAASSAS